MTRKRRGTPREAGPAVRFFRGAIAILGGAAFGSGAGALGTHGLLTATIGPLKPEGWGAGPAWLLFMAVGGGIGLIVGFATAIGWVRGSEMRVFGPFDWLGLLLGIVLAGLLFQLVSDRYDWFMKALWLSVIVPPCLAGMRFLAGNVVVEHLQNRQSAAPRRRR